jgi:hypothetical protein
VHNSPRPLLSLRGGELNGCFRLKGNDDLSEVKGMFWLVLVVIGFWLLMQLYILPKMGVST